MSADGALAARLATVVGRHLGAPVTVEALVPITGGATKHTFAFDATAEGARHRFILQLSTASKDKAASFTPKLSAEQDARLMQSAAREGVLVPKVCTVLEAADGLGNGYVTSRIDGEALGRKIVHDPAFAAARGVLPAQLGTNLAAIHRIDAAAHPELVVFGARKQIAAYAGIVEHYGVQSPALEYALAWARANAPDEAEPTVVHADFRMGNMMVDPRGLAGVLDWEAAHRGDPMQDLGYLCVRTWRFGGAGPVAGIGEREALFDAYEAAGGRPVNAAAVRFWEAWGSIKWAIVAMRKGLRSQDDDQPASLEQCVIGRRMEEPLWDFFQLIGEEKR